MRKEVVKRLRMEQLLVAKCLISDYLQYRLCPLLSSTISFKLFGLLLVRFLTLPINADTELSRDVVKNFMRRE